MSVAHCYFYDQTSRVSHRELVTRCRRHEDDLNEALDGLRSTGNGEQRKIDRSKTTLPLLRSFTSNEKQKHDLLLSKSMVLTSHVKVIPSVVTKQLDQIFEHYPKTLLSSQSEQRSETPPEKNDEGDGEHLDALLLAHRPAVPSLPGALIRGLHNTWKDLIDKTDYSCHVSREENQWRWFRTNDTCSF